MYPPPPPSTEELRFIQTLPPAIYHQIGELLYLHCDVIYDEVLDVAFVWRHNGQPVEEKMNRRFVSVARLSAIFAIGKIGQICQ